MSGLRAGRAAAVPATEEEEQAADVPEHAEDDATDALRVDADVGREVFVGMTDIIDVARFPSPIDFVVDDITTGGRRCCCCFCFNSISARSCSNCCLNSVLVGSAKRATAARCSSARADGFCRLVAVRTAAPACLRAASLRCSIAASSNADRCSCWRCTSCSLPAIVVFCAIVLTIVPSLLDSLPWASKSRVVTVVRIASVGAGAGAAVNAGAAAVAAAAAAVWRMMPKTSSMFAAVLARDLAMRGLSDSMDLLALFGDRLVGIITMMLLLMLLLCSGAVTPGA